MLKSLLALLITILTFLFSLGSKEPNQTVIPTPAPITNTPLVAKNVIALTFANKEYLIYYMKISGNSISLIPNFSQKNSSQTIVSENHCKGAINGGFYNTEGEPLGLFIANGKVYKEEDEEDTSLLTGFFYLDEQGLPHIERNSPVKSNNVIQAGPFIANNKPFLTKTDEEKRRSVLAETENGDFYALAVVEKDDNQFLGPTLASLPPLLFSINTPFKITKALNLDGGSASVFYGTDGYSLTELSTVGSIICIK